MIDVHIHLTPPEIAADRNKYLAGESGFASLYESPKARMAGTAELLKMMDEEGLEKALVGGFTWRNEETAKLHNYWLLEECAKYKGRLYPVAAFDVETPWAFRHAEEMLDAGMFGLGELAVYGSGFDRRILDIFGVLAELCRVRNRILQVHVNEPIGHQYPGKAPLEMSEIYELVKICQGVKLILAHFGGGLPFYAALKKEVKEALENVRFDTAAMPFLFDPAALPMALKVLGPEHFLLGTDYPLLTPARYLRYFAGAGLDAATLTTVCGGSAEKFMEL